MISVIRQIAVSLLILVAVAAGYVLFVPGSGDTLKRYGIDVPFASAATPPEGAGAGSSGRGGAGGGGRGEGGNRTANTQGGASPAGGGGGRPGGRGGFGGRTQTVVVAPVIPATVNDQLTAIGEGAATRSAVVNAPATGLLKELLVAPGDHVEPGTVIGHLDSDLEQIALDKAKLAEADAQQNLARQTELARSNSVAKSALATAQLAASNAELELRNAQLALDRRTITAPIAGTVGLLQVTPGNNVTAQTVVTTIDDTSEILVRFWVPERYATQVRNGMPVTASAVAAPGVVFEGTISAIDNRIDATSRTLQLEARIPNESGTMRAGMSFSVTLRFAGETFLAVDPLSVQWSSDGAYVWRYKDGKVEKAMIQIIQRNSDGVLVSGDVAEGDQIVTEGVLQLSEGASVTLLNSQGQPVATAETAPAGGAGEPLARPAGADPASNPDGAAPAAAAEAAPRGDRAQENGAGDTPSARGGRNRDGADGNRGDRPAPVN